jgi:hypothetical protein
MPAATEFLGVAGVQQEGIAAKERKERKKRTGTQHEQMQTKASTADERR